MLLTLAVAAHPAVGNSSFLLGLAALCAVAALVYLGYAMIRPERF